MSPSESVRVLIVEDSAVARELLRHILSGDPAIRIVGMARNGEEALEEAERLRPDVITMDIMMPGMDGLEATRRIMGRIPLPIIIVSGTVNRREVATTFEALKAGAVAAIPRPAGPGSPEYEAASRELVRTVKAMAEVRVVRRWADRGGREIPAARNLSIHPRAVAIGASTGGPDAIHRILVDLPAGFPLPVLVVQHMAAGFLGGLAEWLSRSSPLPVALGKEGEAIIAGRVYIAPDDRHMGISHDLRIVLSSGPAEKGVRPSVGFLFRTVLKACGRQSVAVLLSGMGDDGVREMKELREAGALTLVQSRESSVIFGMPGEAVRVGAAAHQLSPPQIAEALKKLASDLPEND